jgi:hypothetical protein
MDNFRTDVSISPSDHKISLKTPILTAGSCFADAIGHRLVKNKFQAMANPGGVIYNPVSIHGVLNLGIANSDLPENSFLESQGIHLNYNFHSELSALTKESLSDILKQKIQSIHDFLKSASWIMITYGTSWVYERTDTGETVANCHKVHPSHFKKRLMKEDEVVKSFDAFYAALKKFNPLARIILTVSPVRHLKDTIELNSVSKAILRTACHTITMSHADVDYFPAFEIMMDDLRDYRFYKSDMLHPTEDAEEYIWNKFGDRYFNSDSKEFMKQWAPILAALSHKAFHPASAAHQQFLRSTLQKLESLQSVADVTAEIKTVKKQML